MQILCLPSFLDGFPVESSNIGTLILKPEALPTQTHTHTGETLNLRE